MQKTKLGITVGMLGAAMFFACFFGGFTVSVVLSGYILLFEENAWLRKSAVKGVALLFGFAVLSAIVYLIPEVIDIISEVLGIFGGQFYPTFILKIFSVVSSVLSIIEKLLFIVLGVKSFNQGTVRIPVIDSIVNKYME